MMDGISLKGAKILLVEDDKDAVTIFNGFLKKEGSLITSCLNGLEALELLNETSLEFNIIIMDIYMPLMDGIETAKQIRQKNWRYQNVPIVAWTASWHNGENHLLCGSLFDGCLIKPVSKEELISTIQECLHSHAYA